MKKTATYTSPTLDWEDNGFSLHYPGNTNCIRAVTDQTITSPTKSALITPLLVFKLSSVTCQMSINNSFHQHEITSSLLNAIHYILYLLSRAITKQKDIIIKAQLVIMTYRPRKKYPLCLLLTSKQEQSETYINQYSAHKLY